MKITIDTQQDSHENIKKAIKMLQTIIGEESYSNSSDIFSPDSAATPSEDTGSSAFINIFGDGSSLSKAETISGEKDEADEILNEASEKSKEDKFANEIMEVY